MDLKLQVSRPDSGYRTDIQAVFNEVGEASLDTLLELCHVQAVRVIWVQIFGGDATDQNVADALAGWEPWASLSSGDRLSLVTTRRISLEAISSA